MSEHLALSIVLIALGSCVGSFLNVVIYRLPRGLSVRRPARSFCPACERQISWYDNIPVVSYLLLGGRCRACEAAIPLRYPLVELVTALAFVMTYEAFFIFGLREGITSLAGDWPIFLAHLALWSGLIALAAMDIEAYLVDITVTWVLLGIALACHLAWTPAGSWGQAGEAGWIRPGPWQAALSTAVVAGLAVSAVAFLRSRPGDAEPAAEEVPAEEEHVAGLSAVRPWAGWVIVAGCVVLVSCHVWDVQVTARALEAADGGAGAGALRILVGSAVLFALLALAASHPQPLADTGIVEAIEAEAPDARRQAWSELKFLVPAIALAMGAAVVLWASPTAAAGIERALHWQPAGHWRPIGGLATGLAGWVIGGFIGWSARIFFTLVFGKEALGMGDVHILAAAGAVAGWAVVLLGFFLAAPLALLALAVIAVRRQSRALPYGPWLAMAFFLAALLQDVILGYYHVRWLLQ